jgi:hypothetical protein
VLDVLGTVEPSSPEPRRNTSKSFFEASRSGNKTGNMLPLCCHFVAASVPQPWSRGNKTGWRNWGTDNGKYVTLKEIGIIQGLKTWLRLNFRAHFFALA